MNHFQKIAAQLDRLPAWTPCCSLGRPTAFTPPGSTPPERTAWPWSPAKSPYYFTDSRYIEAPGAVYKGRRSGKWAEAGGMRRAAEPRRWASSRFAGWALEDAYMTVREHEPTEALQL